MDISLAYFTEEQEKDDSGIVKRRAITTEQIEDCILKQLIHRVDKKSLPDSRFDRIKHLSNRRIIIYVLGMLIWAWTFTGIFYPELLSKFAIIKAAWWINSITRIYPVLHFFRICTFLFGSAVFLWKTIRFLNRISIKKLNLKSGTGSIEVQNNNESSLLNRHLDEIIYFFQKTQFNVVIFEDLDRFKNISIFSKLREINFLINQSSSIKHDVVFIYA